MTDDKGAITSDGRDEAAVPSPLHPPYPSPSSEAPSSSSASASPYRTHLSNGGRPLPNREATNVVLDALLEESWRPSTEAEVFGCGPMVVSDIPRDCRGIGRRGRGAIMGIDEAGRGPVCGPMTYAAAYWNPRDGDAADSDDRKDGDGADDVIPVGFNDSKQLTPAKRASLFADIRRSSRIGFVLRVLHASELSRNMLRKNPYNLNTMSHDAAIGMIRTVLDAGVKIDTCYVDTVGIADNYRTKLERAFEGHDIEFVVEKKADAKYATCSAASIVAKESRDAILANWKYTENFDCVLRSTLTSNDYGSGYPSDPKAKSWLGIVHRGMRVDDSAAAFGFPDLVRFSWNPAKTFFAEDEAVYEEAQRRRNGGMRSSIGIFGNGCGDAPVVVRWEADEEEEKSKGGEDDEGKQQSRLDCFMVNKSVKDAAGLLALKRNGEMRTLEVSFAAKRARMGIFQELGLSKVTTFSVEAL